VFRDTRFLGGREFIPVYKVLLRAAARVPRASEASDGGPGLSPVANLSCVQEQIAKTCAKFINFIDRVSGKGMSTSP
jgi:hypothetical protein